MRYMKVLSGLLLTGMLAASANAQDKPKPVEKPLEVLRYLADKGEPTIANIVANHPDVKLAEAKLQVAKAELEQARLLITQKYTVAKARLEEAKTVLTHSENRLRSIAGHNTTDAERDRDVLSQTLAQVKTAIAIAEADLKALQGTPNLKAEISFFDFTIDEYKPTFGVPILLKDKRWVPKPTTQSAKLREVLERKIALDLTKSLPLDEVMAILLPKSGLDAFLVRYPEWASAKSLKQPPTIYLPKSEQTVAAWLQLMVDEFNSRDPQLGGIMDSGGKYEVYIRDYGLLFAKATMAPQGALRLEEFMRLPPVVEAPKEAPKK